MAGSDQTWVRKDKDNKLLNWLLHYPLVWLSDLWHFANAINALALIIMLVLGLHLDYQIVIPIVFYVVMNSTFNLFYHWVLKK